MQARRWRRIDAKAEAGSEIVERLRVAILDLRFQIVFIPEPDLAVDFDFVGVDGEGGHG